MHLVGASVVCRPDVALATSIALETASTLCLQRTIRSRRWFVPAYLGYATSFALFPHALSKYPLSVAYTCWSGAGMAVTAVHDVAFSGVRLRRSHLAGMLLIGLGIFMVC